MIKILKCEICGKECKNESSLKSHYSKSHEDNILIDNSLKCKNPNCNNSIIKKYIENYGKRYYYNKNKNSTYCSSKCMLEFNHRQKYSFVKHCENKAVCLWRNEWTFAYEENDFNKDLPSEYDSSLRKGTNVKLIDLQTNEEKTFNSLNKLNSYLGKRKGELKFTNNECLYDNYKIIKL